MDNQQLPPPQPISDGPEPGLANASHNRRSMKKVLLWIVLGFVGVVVALATTAVLWYQNQLTPVEPTTSNTRVVVEVVAGSTPQQIGLQLEEQGVIRSARAFAIYTRLADVRGSLQAGSYRLSPADSTPDIVGYLVEGRVEQFTITFLPGATLAQHRQVLLDVGYSETEVDEALSQDYTHALFQDKPATADLEGYIFGETYTFGAEVAVPDILVHSFDTFYAAIERDDLATGWAEQGLSQYEGITLASIIQREVSGEQDSRQVAQIFLKRLADGMSLGADATFVYAAEKAGQTPSVDFDSPYNTRIYGGLPPGPIASPGVNALRAVANPAPGDYLYFVSGDDGTNHFARTLAEHEANTRAYCQANCALF